MLGEQAVEGYIHMVTVKAILYQIVDACNRVLKVQLKG